MVFQERLRFLPAMVYVLLHPAPIAGKRLQEVQVPAGVLRATANLGKSCDISLACPHLECTVPLHESVCGAGNRCILTHKDGSRAECRQCTANAGLSSVPLSGSPRSLLDTTACCSGHCYGSSVDDRRLGYIESEETGLVTTEMRNYLHADEPANFLSSLYIVLLGLCMAFFGGVNRLQMTFCLLISMSGAIAAWRHADIHCALARSLDGASIGLIQIFAYGVFSPPIRTIAMICALIGVEVGDAYGTWDFLSYTPVFSLCTFFYIGLAVLLYHRLYCLRSSLPYAPLLLLCLAFCVRVADCWFTLAHATWHMLAGTACVMITLWVFPSEELQESKAEESVYYRRNSLNQTRA